MDFKGKIVFGDPPCLKLRPPLERESLPQKTPQNGDLRLGLDPQ